MCGRYVVGATVPWGRFMVWGREPRVGAAAGVVPVRALGGAPSQPAPWQVRNVLSWQLGPVRTHPVHVNRTAHSPPLMRTAFALCLIALALPLSPPRPSPPAASFHLGILPSLCLVCCLPSAPPPSPLSQQSAYVEWEAQLMEGKPNWNPDTNVYKTRSYMPPMLSSHPGAARQ